VDKQRALAQALARKPRAPTADDFADVVPAQPLPEVDVAMGEPQLLSRTPEEEAPLQFSPWQSAGVGLTSMLGGPQLAALLEAVQGEGGSFLDRANAASDRNDAFVSQAQEQHPIASTLGSMGGLALTAGLGSLLRGKAGPMPEAAPLEPAAPASMGGMSLLDKANAMQRRYLNQAAQAHALRAPTKMSALGPEPVTEAAELPGPQLWAERPPPPLERPPTLAQRPPRAARGHGPEEKTGPLQNPALRALLGP
jgi:hypothetical protein